MAEDLSLLQEKFIAEYCRNGGNATQAYLVAGGKSLKNSRKIAHVMLHRPEVQAALQKLRTESRETAKYGVEQAVKELDERIRKADEAGQHNAVASLIKLKLQIRGLLIERHDVRQATSFSINITGIDGPTPVEEIGEPPTLQLSQQLEGEHGNSSDIFPSGSDDKAIS